MRAYVCVCVCAILYVCIFLRTSCTHRVHLLPPVSNKLFYQLRLLQVFADLDSFYCHIFKKLTIDDFGIYIFFLLIYRCCILLSDC